MATALELSQHLGALVSIDCGGLVIDCRVEDVRTRFGCLDFLITPLSGSGSRWVESSSVRVSLAGVSE